MLAAFDRISRRAAIRPEMYERYEEFGLDAYDLFGDYPTRLPAKYVNAWKQFQREIWAQLGVPVRRNIQAVKVDSEKELDNTLQRLLGGGFRTVLLVDTDGYHAIGVLSGHSGLYSVRSTWVPFRNPDRVTTAELFSYLWLRPRIRVGNGRSKKEVNVIALPPERK
jgi:hypothetical protein